MSLHEKIKHAVAGMGLVAITLGCVPSFEVTRTAIKGKIPYKASISYPLPQIFFARTIEQQGNSTEISYAICEDDLETCAKKFGYEITSPEISVGGNEEDISSKLGKGGIIFSSIGKINVDIEPNYCAILKYNEKTGEYRDVVESKPCRKVKPTVSQPTQQQPSCPTTGQPPCQKTTGVNDPYNQPQCPTTGQPPCQKTITGVKEKSADRW